MRLAPLAAFPGLIIPYCFSAMNKYDMNFDTLYFRIILIIHKFGKTMIHMCACLLDKQLTFMFYEIRTNLWMEFDIFGKQQLYPK